MCIRRHLITLLNASKNTKKHQCINQAVSLDSSPMREDEDGNMGTYANIIPDKKDPADKLIEVNEAYEVTKKALFGALSSFERIVLAEYLASSSYREISKNLTKATKKRHNTKSIDNALLRIRKKAMQLLKYSKKEDLPIFLPKSI
jgi:DNA-directed RNA polymerase specialized sigma24 family protein